MKETPDVRYIKNLVRLFAAQIEPIVQEPLNRVYEIVESLDPWGRVEISPDRQFLEESQKADNAQYKDLYFEQAADIILTVDRSYDWWYVNSIEVPDNDGPPCYKHKPSLGSDLNSALIPNAIPTAEFATSMKPKPGKPAVEEKPRNPKKHYATKVEIEDVQYCMHSGGPS